jgi:hypothetical protein
LNLRKKVTTTVIILSLPYGRPSAYHARAWLERWLQRWYYLGGGATHRIPAPAMIQGSGTKTFQVRFAIEEHDAFPPAWTSLL